MTSPFFAGHRLNDGLTYAAYMDLMAERAATPEPADDAEAAERIGYTKLNLHRSGRISRTWRPSDELAALAARLVGPQLWMVLTEPWCGDSAQCLPYIKLLTDLNPAIDLRLILRDTNLDIMDAFLTDGKRSIPRLVIFAADGRVLGQWGPRPAEAQVVFAEAKSAGLEKPQLLEKLHLWYGRNRGQALAAEFTALLTGMSGA